MCSYFCNYRSVFYLIIFLCGKVWTCYDFWWYCPCMNRWIRHFDSIFVATFSIKGGLNHKIFRCWFLFLSKTQEIFEEEKFPYDEALKQSGCSQKLSYQQSNDIHWKRNWQPKILWFNLPFSENVATNVGWEFLKIVEKNFLVNHKYNRIFNKNTVKVSYSCMNNMDSIIKNHNIYVHTTPQRKIRR